MKHPIKLYYFSYDHPENPWCGGGGSYRDEHILNYFKDHGIEITLYCGKFPNTPKTNPFPTYFIGTSSTYFWSRVSYCFAAHFKIFSIDRKDVIGYSFSPLAPLFLSFGFRKNVYTVIHHLIGQLSLKKFGFFGYIPIILEYLLAKHYSHFFISNASVLKRIKKINSHAVLHLTQNGIDKFLLTPTSTRPIHPTILYFGRFDFFMKGIDLLVTAFSHFNRKHPEYRLAIAGKATSEQITKLQDLAKKEKIEHSIDIHPNVSDSKKQDLMANCLFFCSPSRFEGWGISSLEAMAQGKCVLVSQAEGFLESVGNSGAAILLTESEILNPVLFAQTIEKLAIDHGFRESLEKNANSWAKKFTWEAIAEFELQCIRSDFIL